MHILLILILLCLAFPIFARLLGAALRVMFRLVLVGLIVELVEVFVH